jgi:CheY-like chemotaxis protein
MEMSEHSGQGSHQHPYPPIRRTDEFGRFKPEQTNAYVGVQIRTGRRLLGILRGGLAAELGADYNTLSAYEHGVCEVPPVVMARIAHILRKPLPWFRGGPVTHEGAPLPVAVTASGEWPRVLLVDDAPDVLVVLGAFLEGAGLRVRKASSGDEALRIIGSDEVLDAIVTDNAMPGLSGADLLMQAAQLRPSLPGLIITGAVEARNLLELPATVDIMAKPFRREELTIRVHEMIKQHANRHTASQ